MSKNNFRKTPNHALIFSNEKYIRKIRTQNKTPKKQLTQFHFFQNNPMHVQKVQNPTE